ncbi:hypothetical protein MVEN_00108900 [Mycena venus]|uniref:Cytochrome P450 n=1 Tax=Mycena venus TaxID=2733690 RepID=A0A8H6Z527_9AGAR|nr:hypothetical protein MVEN_00108900 [Mycena venus]
MLPPQYGDHEFQWQKTYGSVYRIKGCFGSLSYVQGNTHKRLRAAINVGFNAAAVRKYQPVFEKLAHELAEQLEAISGSTVDMLPRLGVTTLSAICDVVFGVSINDVEEELVSNYFQLTCSTAFLLPDRIRC